MDIYNLSHGEIDLLQWHGSHNNGSLKPPGYHTVCFLFDVENSMM